MSWINILLMLIVAALVATVFLQLFAYRHLARKLNSLNEYIQFVLFLPEVYENHRNKFLDFLNDSGIADPMKLTHASWEAIEKMAAILEGDVLVHNFVARSDPAKLEEARRHRYDSN